MTIELSNAYQAALIIKEHAPHFNATIGIVLGSGLSDFAAILDNKIHISYDLLPHFPRPTVHGHGHHVVLGTLNGVGVVCLQGRMHHYEGDANDVIKTYIRTLKCLGCDYFIATNASGSLREDVGPGELMLITDHINFQPTNPLVGPNDDAFGARFYPLDDAYDKTMQQSLLKIAQQENIALNQGVYVSVLGPHYETAAEIRAFRILGADAVGMSTVPEVLVANHCGMKVAVIAIITNYATGLSSSSHSHEAVVMMAQLACEKLKKLLKQYVMSLG